MRNRNFLFSLNVVMFAVNILIIVMFYVRSWPFPFANACTATFNLIGAIFSVLTKRSNEE